MRNACAFRPSGGIAALVPTERVGLKALHLKPEGGAVTETKKPSFAERFAEAFQKAMKDEHEETASLPKVFGKRDGLVDIVDPDDKHLG